MKRVLPSYLLELRVSSSVRQAIAMLVGQQRPDGSFVVVAQDSSPREISYIVTLAVHATLLDLLAQSSRPEVKRPAKNLAEYVARELLHDNFTDTLNKADTRTVFHALAALYEYDPALLPPPALAASIHFLTTREVNPGGPYRNILARPDRTDRDTNRSIGRFLYRLGGPFPALLRYALSTEESRYFTKPWAVALQRRLLARAARQEATTLIHDAVDVQQVDYFYQDYYAADGQCYGAPAIGAARVLCAADNVVKQKLSTQSIDQQLIVMRARTALQLPEAESILSRITAADHNNEIGLFAVRFAKGLSGKRLAPKTLEMLGAANLLNWTAYTIYDDILDDDSDGKLLSAANTALRGSVRLFKEAVPDAWFCKQVDAHFDAVDAANSWELTHGRFRVTQKTVSVGTLPDYSDLHHVYERSLTHRLPLLATLIAAGHSPRSRSVITLAKAFAQYLTIRQLNDDLHDWREDLRGGRISYVVARLLTDAHVRAGTHAFTQLMPKLEKVFLHTTLPAIATELLDIAKQAHAAIRKVHILQAVNILSELISAYEQSMRNVLSEQQNGVVLLDVFSLNT